MHGAGDGDGAAALEHAVPQSGTRGGKEARRAGPWTCVAAGATQQPRPACLPAWWRGRLPGGAGCGAAGLAAGVPRGWGDVVSSQAGVAGADVAVLTWRGCPGAGGRHVSHRLHQGTPRDPAAPVSRVQGLSVPVLQPRLEGAPAGLHLAAPPLPGRCAAALAGRRALPQRGRAGAGGGRVGWWRQAALALGLGTRCEGRAVFPPGEHQICCFVGTPLPEAWRQQQLAAPAGRPSH